MPLESLRKPKLPEYWFLHSRILATLLLSGRIMTGLAFMALALGQIKHYDDFTAALAAVGLPSGHALVITGILLTFLGSVSLVLGVFSRAGAAILLLLTLYTLPYLFFGHANLLLFTAGMAIAGGLIPHIVAGGGEFCLDKLYGDASRRRASRRPSGRL